MMQRWTTVTITVCAIIVVVSSCNQPIEPQHAEPDEPTEQPENPPAPEHPEWLTPWSVHVVDTESGAPASSYYDTTPDNHDDYVRAARQRAELLTRDTGRPHEVVDRQS